MAEEQNQEHGQQSNSDRNSDDEQRRRTNPRRKRTIRLIVIALIVVTVIVAIPIYAYYSVRESTDDAQVDGHIVPISPRIAGTILTVLVDDNHPVKAGQELVRLDPTDYQLTFGQAEAQVANAQAAVAESSANI